MSAKVSARPRNARGHFWLELAIAILAALNLALIGTHTGWFWAISVVTAVFLLPWLMNLWKTGSLRGNSADTAFWTAAGLGVMLGGTLVGRLL